MNVLSRELLTWWSYWLSLLKGSKYKVATVIIK